MRRKRKASFKPTLVRSSSAWVKFLPRVSIMGVFGFMLRSLVSWACGPKSAFMALRSALLPLPLSPVMRTMSVGRMLSETLS